MSEKFEDLKKLVAFARKSGLEELKIDGIEFKLNPGALFPESAYKQKKSEQSEELPKIEDALSAEDILFWSSSAEA